MLVNAITLIIIIIAVVTIGSCQPIHFELLYTWQCNARYVYVCICWRYVHLLSYPTKLSNVFGICQHLRKDLW